MAMTDALSTFALNTPLGGGAPGTEIIGDAINIVDARNVGAGLPPVYLVVSAATALTGATGTIQFELKTGAADPIVAGDDDLVISPSKLATDVAVGDVLWVVALPGEGTPYEQYIGLAAVTGVAAVDGSINAYMTGTPPQWKAYPEGQN